MQLVDRGCKDKAMPPAAAESANERLPADRRREALLDVARALVVEGGADAVTMGAVAERAEVTRALVYKHFENRGAILAALYRREAAALDRAMRHVVLGAPDGFEPRFRALVHGTVAAVAKYGHFFPALRAYGHDTQFKSEQRAWDRRTVGYFADLAVTDYGIDKDVARKALAIILGGIDSVISLAQASRGAAAGALIEDIFVEMAVASLRHLAENFGN
jgi:AcrR family transcriptional regulator